MNIASSPMRVLIWFLSLFGKNWICFLVSFSICINYSFAADVACLRPEVSTINPDRSLLVHDKLTINGSNGHSPFSLSKLLGAIISSKDDVAIPDIEGQKLALLNSMLATFDSSKGFNRLSGLETRIDQRPDERKLAPSSLLDSATKLGLLPVAIVNRIDLMPIDFSDCGEYRIVYSLASPLSGDFGRLFLIFEAKLDNPSRDPETCATVAKYWTKLTAVEDADERLNLLSKFFFDGIEGKTGPAVSWSNYGEPLGQIRGNLFIKPTWMLREWRLELDQTQNKIEFAVDSVKDNLLAEFYSSNLTGSLAPKLQNELSLELLTNFGTPVLLELFAPDLAGDKTAIETLNEFALQNFGNQLTAKYEEFQSASDGSDQIRPSTQFLAQIDKSLAELQANHGITATTEEVINRLSALTCQGCHQRKNLVEPFSIGTLNGEQLLWPSDSNFVHISEFDANGIAPLSEALSRVFLPYRASKLADATCLLPESGLRIAQSQAEIEYLSLRQKIVVERTAGSEQLIELGKLRTLVRDQARNQEGYFVKIRRSH